MGTVELLPSNVIDKIKETPGALSVAEAIAIYNVAKLSPHGLYMELGSHKGKSSMAAACGLKKGVFYLVEPEFEDKNWASTVGDSISVANSDLAVDLVADYSTNVIDKYSPYAYVFWDSGEHGGEVLKKETELLEDAIIPGGILCSHDIGNQFTQQKEAMDYLVSTGKYEWIPIDWPAILKYVADNNLEEGNNSWHVYPDLGHAPNFVGAIRRK
ncbi:MAG TPA: hypothetical protein PKV73_01185 [Agriterribacter sp.]|nr:hypothetical protein [Agriterribacter sp.]